MAERSEVASYLGYLLRRVRRQATQLTSDEVDPTGGRAESHANQLRELAVLALIAEIGSPSQQVIAERLGINRSAMVKVIDALEANGEVLRTRDAADRRRYAIELTSEGRARLETLSWRFEAIAETLTRPLSEAERRRLVELLTVPARCHGPEGLPSRLASQPVWLTGMVQQGLESFVDARLAPLGLDTRIFVSLAILSGMRCNQSDLGAHMVIGPATTVELVDALERRGAVQRVRSTLDRRVYELQLTEVGRQLHHDARSVVVAASEEYFRDLGTADHEELVTLLARLAALEEPVGTSGVQERQEPPGAPAPGGALVDRAGA